MLLDVGDSGGGRVDGYGMVTSRVGKRRVGEVVGYLGKGGNSGGAV
jgi:hypothetical protein